MASSVSSSVSDHKGVLSLNGRFDFSIHRDFRSNYENILNADGVNELSQP